MTQDTPSDTGTLDYDTEPDEEWLEEPDELPRRPRRKLLGVGGNPIPLTLLVVLLIAGAFFAGVEVEKGQTSSSTGSGFPSGLAALRSRLGTGGASRSGAAAGAGGGFPAAGTLPRGGGGFPGVGGFSGGGITTGEVSFASGNTLYVTSGEGNTIKVSAPKGTRVSKTVTTNVHSIHPGDTVIVRGSQNKNGSVSASSITVSSSGGSGAGGGSSTSSGGAVQQLFGSN